MKALLNVRLLLRLVPVLALLTLALPAPALAAPANDNFGNATPIGALPYGDSEDMSLAATEPGEPQVCSFSPRTVWYSFTPSASGLVKADMAGSSFSDTNLRVYQAVSPGIFGLNLVPNGCVTFGGSVTFNAQAGTTYYLQAGTVFSSFGTSRVNVQAVLPPANDDLANATPIGSLPFQQSVDTTAATRQAGEPAGSCASGAQGGTVWYAFMPAASGSVSASADSNGPFSTVVAAYTGISLPGLTEVACRSFGGLSTFHVNAGTTYYFQVGSFGAGGPLQFHLQVAPAPTANFFVNPSDPSTFDTIQFNDVSFDPAGVGINTRAWDFGDGATASGTNCCPTHRYASDGDYTAKLTITTVDGRTASTSQTVHVKTHDVAITKFAAPQSAHAGQTRQVSVGVSSKQYEETVQVQLYKSIPGVFQGYQLVGTLTETVPARSTNRTTDFAFSYTFTGDDATIGKVTFKAVATVVGARDALPADNEAIASPTKVSA